MQTTFKKEEIKKYVKSFLKDIPETEFDMMWKYTEDVLQLKDVNSTENIKKAAKEKAEIIQNNQLQISDCSDADLQDMKKYLVLSTVEIFCSELMPDDENMNHQYNKAEERREMTEEEIKEHEKKLSEIKEAIHKIHGDVRK